MGIAFGETGNNDEEYDYDELLDDIRERLYKDDPPFYVSEIMHHVKEALKHWKELRGIK